MTRPPPIVVPAPGLSLQVYVVAACEALSAMRLHDHGSLLRRLADGHKYGELATYTDRLLTMLDGAAALAAATGAEPWQRHVADTRQTLLALLRRLGDLDRAAETPRFERVV